MKIWILRVALLVRFLVITTNRGVCAWTYTHVHIIHKYTHIQHVFLKETLENVKLWQCGYLDIWVNVCILRKFYHTLN